MRHLRDSVTALRFLRTFWFAGLSFVRIYRRLILLERPLDQSPPQIRTRASMRVTMLAGSELDAYVAFRPDQDAVEIRRRLDQEHQCFVVWQGREIIHAAWVATGRATIDYLSREIVLALDEVYVYDSVTAPAFRGRGASPVRAVALGEHFHALGYRRLLTAVHPENWVGFRPLEKLGTRRVGVIGYFGLGRWRWQFCRRRG